MLKRMRKRKNGYLIRVIKSCKMMSFEADKYSVES